MLFVIIGKEKRPLEILNTASGREGCDLQSCLSFLMNSLAKGQKQGSKSKEDAPHELESQYILRLPSEHAAIVRRAVQSGNVNLKDRLTIELHPDGRHGIVRVDKQPLASRLVEMPCVIESLKTIDKKTFYKTADVCQMLVCSTDGELYPPQEEPVPVDPKNKKKDKDKEKKFLWNHSITCPLKNVRKRRFRKTAKKKYIESPDVEKEVKRLLSTDADAVSVRILPGARGVHVISRGGFIRARAA
ncbi:LOW QUALITY PROTEIN: transcription initiation factor TFIID subunit 7 [Heptranchias perlo]|uniref:LOW QUALITY PROTEIN: transcription initiation factor TFIID subunit 7 n=1 Tax=Heptranchias perlo TaxID=212740 RepID=UPI00355A594E